MRQSALGGLLLMLATVLGAQSTPTAPSFDVPLIGQMAQNWCWAASAQMAMQALGAPEDSVRQEDQAGRSFLTPEQCYSNACAEPPGRTSATCAFGGFPQFYKFGFDSEVTPLYRPLTWSELWQELGCKRPVVFAREDLDSGQRSGIGHMVVATSAGIADNGPWIAVNDPAPPCQGSKRSETYDEYRGGTSKAHWIDYYSLRNRSMPFIPCIPPQPPVPSPEIRESSSAVELVNGFIAAIHGNTWIRESAGLTGESDLHCDLGPDIAEKRISIASLRNAAPGALLDSLLVDTGRRRFLCGSGDAQVFSVEVEIRPGPLGRWRVATLGDVELATRLRAILAARKDGQEIQEVFVSGLNVHFARVVGDKSAKAISLYAFPGPFFKDGPQSERDLLDKLREAAAVFHGTGPT